MPDNYRPRTIIDLHAPVQKTFQIKPNHLYPRLANFPSLNHHLCNHSLHTHTHTCWHISSLFSSYTFLLNSRILLRACLWVWSSKHVNGILHKPLIIQLVYILEITLIVIITPLSSPYLWIRFHSENHTVHKSKHTITLSHNRKKN